MNSYTKLLRAGLLPEFINYEQAEIVATNICHDCFTAAIDDHTVESKTKDNGDISINTVSLLKFLEQADKKCVNRRQNERLLYLMEIKDGKIE